MKNSEHAEIFKGIHYSPRLRGEKVFSKTKRICGEVVWSGIAAAKKISPHSRIFYVFHNTTA
jgi:hypothetical protein